MLKKRIILSLLYLALFILAGVSTFGFVYVFANVIGSTIMGVPFQNMGQIYPLVSAAAGPIMFLIYFHFYLARKSVKGRYLSLIIFGLVQMAFSTAALIYTFSMILSGGYESQIIGYPTPLYPIDAILYHIVILFAGCFLYLYGLKQKTRYREDFPLREMTPRYKRVSFGIFGTFGLLTTLYSVGVLIMSCTFGPVSSFNVNMVTALTLYLLAPVLLFALYMAKEFFPELKEKKKLYLTLVICVVAYIMTTLLGFFMYFFMNPGAYLEVSQAYYPWSYMASVGIGMILLTLTSLGGVAYTLLSLRK